ncbi:MAG: hypothetical protein J5966_03385 [Lachnospiraceae bacterium]|nr:hypothetical protein [Lachnospiraceae bacterium]
MEDKNLRMSDAKENALEWLVGSDTITATINQRKFKNKLQHYAEIYPNEVRIDKINSDGSMLCHFPAKYLHISRPRELTEEEKAAAALRLKGIRKR